MNKKLFGTLLLSSLLMGGTFVSCQDYDDEIANLQEQINNLATKSDVEARLSQLQSSLATAQSTADAAKKSAEEALAAAKAADNSAEIAKLESQIKDAAAKLAEIEKAQAAVDKAIEALKNEVADKVAEMAASTKEAIAEAQKKTEETVGKVADYVTAVDFVLTDNADPSVKATPLLFTTITEQANVFGKDLAGEMTFVKGAQVQRPAKSFVVRVSPTNAVLTGEMISLVSSDGKNLNDMVDIAVKPYKGLLTRSETGLWEVTATLKAYDKKAFDAVAQAKVGGVMKNILYAVQVNNTISSAESRYVTSAYDVELGTQAYTNVNALNYFVADKPLAQVQNRYGLPGAAPEYKWKTVASTTPVAANPDPSKINVIADATDNRSAQAAYPLVQGTDLTITLDQTGATSVSNASAADIKALYVTLDAANAIESAPSELNAWNTYSYTGLNTVVMGNKATISVNGATAIKDVIGFRVYAVNWDGTLVDPDGKAFYVKVGTAATEFSGVSVTIKPISDDATQKVGLSDKVTFAKQTAAAKVTFRVDKNDDGVNFKVRLMDGTCGASAAAGSEQEIDLGAAYVTAFQGNLKDVKVQVIAVNALNKYKDGKTYTGSINVYDADNFLIYTVPVRFTKELPTAADFADVYSWKAGQLVGGVYTSYVFPAGDVWTAAATGAYKDMAQAINLPAPYNPQLVISVANAKLAGTPASYKDPAVTTGSYQLNYVGTTTDQLKALIDNSTMHASSIDWNCGLISSETKNEYGTIVDYVVNLEKYNTVLACPLDKTVQTLAWKKYEAAATATLPAVSKDLNVITYNQAWAEEAQDGTALTLTDYLIATNAFDNTIFGGKFSAASVNGKYVSATAKLISNETGNEDYFTVAIAGGVLTFTPQSGTTNPAANVPSTLVIKLKDCFNHEVSYELPFTVKRAE